METKANKQVVDHVARKRLTVVEKALKDMGAEIGGVKGDIETIRTELSENTANTLAILDNVQALRAAGTFAKKWGPRIILFVTGGLSAAGVGNPKLLAYINAVFGGG